MRQPERMDTGRIWQTALSVAVLLATLFTGFSPKMLAGGLDERFGSRYTPQPGANPAAVSTAEPVQRIGIVAGHWGNDSGTVCANGVTEQQVNYAIANLVRDELSAWDYQVDLLQEFDPRLDGYQAVALISIHNDSCTYVNDQATGFKVAASEYSRDANLTGRLTACLVDRFQRAAGLPIHPGSITVNMQDYHAFRDIDPRTPAAIIETGFLYLDYDILTQRPDLIANGIVAGVMCYLRNESVEIAPTP
jgi:N-acetylmuramoyl-L-alanine amidase